MGAHPEAVTGLEADPRWQLAQRIAASPAFQRSAHLRAFLLYVVEKTLSNRQQEITEQFIGSRVLGRRPDYDPNQDNIVRVQAWRLRARLKEYFQGDGRGEALLLQIPAGTYIPVFRTRSPATDSERAAPSSLLRWTPWVLSGVLAASCVWLALGWSGDDPAALRRRPWSQLFGDGHTTSIVVADSCFALVQDIEQRSLSLKDYLDPSGLPRQGLSGLVLARQFTSFADVMLANRFQQIAGRHRDRVQIRYARDLQLRDFKSGHFVLLGSSRSNPWVGLFAGRRNFEAGFDPGAKRPLFRNRSPRAGEQAAYVTEGVDGKAGETWGVISFLPGREGGGNVLIVEGTNMEGTEAAGEFLADPASLDVLWRGLPAGAGYFEVLLRSTAMAGTARDTRIAAIRVIE